MKKIGCLLLTIMLLFLGIKQVWAEEVKTYELIPALSSAIVSTDNFTYVEFVYQPPSNPTVDGVVNFNLIQNNKITKTAVSINLLLFDSEKKNIGLVAYCSDKDISSNYEGYKIAGRQSSPFSIMVNNKYLVNGKTAMDVAYIAVMDDNKYCKIGGYDKYAGKSVEEIENTGVINTDEGNSDGDDFDDYFKWLYDYLEDEESVERLINIGIIIFAFILVGTILTNLYRKMYSKTTLLAYLPITNGYVAVKMAFGNIIGIVFLLIYLLSCGLFYINIPIVFYICCGFFGLAFLVDLLKMITNKYDLLYLEPSIKVDNIDDNSVFDSKHKKDKNNKKSRDNEPILDLSYNDRDVDNTVGLNDMYNNTDDDEMSDNMFNSNIGNVGIDDNTFNSSISNVGLDDNYDDNEDTSNSLLDDDFEFKSDDNDEDNLLDDNSIGMGGAKNNSDSSEDGESDLSKFFH